MQKHEKDILYKFGPAFIQRFLLNDTKSKLKKTRNMIEQPDIR